METGEGDKTSIANSITTQRPMMMMNKFIWENVLSYNSAPGPVLDDTGDKTQGRPGPDLVLPS